MNPKIKYPNEVTQIIEHLSNPDSAIQFFLKTNIAQIDEIKDIHQYARMDGRRGLAMNVNEKKNSENSQIVLDVKHGPPSTDQLCECIHGAGNFSNKRILMYTGFDNVDHKNPAADVNLVSRLVRNYNNEYSLNLFLIRVSVPTSQGKALSFQIDVKPEYPPNESLSEKVDERVFREMEFWFAFINSLDPGFYKNWTPPMAENFLNFDYGHYTNAGFLQVRENFNSFGAFIWVVQRDDGKNLLMDLWRNKAMELKKLFADHEIELEYRPSKTPVLAVKISDHPLGWLLGATVSEKLEFARELHGKYLAMVKFIRQAL